MGTDTPLLSENMEQQKVQFSPAFCRTCRNQGKRTGSLSDLNTVQNLQTWSALYSDCPKDLEKFSKILRDELIVEELSSSHFVVGMACCLDIRK